jgi:hypothetical protein
MASLEMLLAVVTQYAPKLDAPAASATRTTTH